LLPNYFTGESNDIPIFGPDAATLGVKGHIGRLVEPVNSHARRHTAICTATYDSWHHYMQSIEMARNGDTRTLLPVIN
jgi:hypothetical protein